MAMLCKRNCWPFNECGVEKEAKSDETGLAVRDSCVSFPPIVAGGIPDASTSFRDIFYPPLSVPHAAGLAIDLEKGLPTEGRPANFGIVAPGVYRSSFPKADDYDFLRGLKLKTVITLVAKEFPEEYAPFLRQNGIQHCVFDIQGTKKESISTAAMGEILRKVLDRRNHPVLIHCNKGRHRTGCVVGAVRKLSGWSVDRIVREYTDYAQPKPRDCDIGYLAALDPADFDPSALFRAERDALLERAAAAAADQDETRVLHATMLVLFVTMLATGLGFVPVL